MFSFPQTSTLVQLKKLLNLVSFSILIPVLWVVKYIMSSFVSVLTVKIYENILLFFYLKEVWEIIWLRRQSPTQHGIYMTGFQLSFYPTNRTRVQLTIEWIKEFLHPSCREPTTDKINIACNVNDVPTRQKDSINILNFPLLKR